MGTQSTWGFNSSAQAHPNSVQDGPHLLRCDGPVLRAVRLHDVLGSRHVLGSQWPRPASLFSKELGDSTTAGGFFARMVGLGFMIMFLGKTRFGVSDDAWMKTTVTFHVGSLWWFWKLTTAAGWTPWVWQLQCLLNVVFAAWGVQSMGGVDKLLKQD